MFLGVTDGGTAQPPKQNTEEKGVKTTPVTNYHRDLSSSILEYHYLTSDFSKGLMFLDLTSKYGVSEDSIFIEKMSDGYFKIKPALPPEEYKKLVGERFWKTIESKYESEKYLVYDDTQEKDPITQLYPEFYLMFKKSPYIKINWTRYEDDGRPDLSIDFKSDSEYNSGK